MSAYTDRELRQKAEKIRDLYELEGKTVKNADEAQQVITLFQDRIIDLWEQYAQALKQELKQSLEAHRSVFYIESGGEPIDYVPMSAIDFVFQDKGDNRE